MRTGRFLAAALALMVCSQPCLAAGHPQTPDGLEQRRGAFAGLNLKLPLGSRAKPSARLKLAPVREDRDPLGATQRRSIGDGIEIGLARRGDVAWFVGDRELSAQNDRLRARGSTTTWIIVGGGVIVALVLLASIAGAQPTAGPPDGAF